MRKTMIISATILLIALFAGSVLAGITIRDTTTGKSVSGSNIWDAVRAFLGGNSNNRVTGRAVGGIATTFMGSPGPQGAGGTNVLTAFPPLTSGVSCNSGWTSTGGTFDAPFGTDLTLVTTDGFTSTPGTGTCTQSFFSGVGLPLGSFTGCTVTPTFAQPSIGILSTDSIDWITPPELTADCNGGPTDCGSDTFTWSGTINVPPGADKALTSNLNNPIPFADLTGTFGSPDTAETDVGISTISGSVFCPVLGQEEIVNGITANVFFSTPVETEDEFGAPGIHEYLIGYHTCQTQGGTEPLNIIEVTGGQQADFGGKLQVSTVVEGTQLIGSGSITIESCSSGCLTDGLSCNTNADCGFGQYCNDANGDFCNGECQTGTVLTTANGWEFSKLDVINGPVNEIVDGPARIGTRTANYELSPRSGFGYKEDFVDSAQIGSLVADAIAKGWTQISDVAFVVTQDEDDSPYGAGETIIADNCYFDEDNGDAVCSGDAGPDPLGSGASKVCAAQRKCEGGLRAGKYIKVCTDTTCTTDADCSAFKYANAYFEDLVDVKFPIKGYKNYPKAKNSCLPNKDCEVQGKTGSNSCKYTAPTP